MRVASVREISKQGKAGKARVRGDAKAAKPGSKTKLRLVKPAQKGDGSPTPLQQEALILKYRLKARKLGRSILRRWHARMDLDEVDSLVDLSLCEAVKRFNPSKGASFMTFLFYHLKGNLVRSVASAAASSALPTALLADGEGAPLSGELMGELSLRGLNSAEIAEAISSQDSPQPDDVLWKKQLHSQSSLACEKLDALEQEIIKRIFIQEQQIMDIATSLGYSRCHISRVKKKALETLYDELRGAMNQDDLGQRPSFDDDSDEDVEQRLQSRKAIHRRRPRSRAAKQEPFAPARAA
jgi:RNA polymerase sigma factor (sigma-70 family)